MRASAAALPAALFLALALPVPAGAAASPSTGTTTVGTDQEAVSQESAAAAGGPTVTVEGAAPVQAQVDVVEVDPAGLPASAHETTLSAPGGDLVVVGVSWADVEAGDGLTAQLRSRQGETWSAWSELEITAPLSAEETTEGMRGGTEPMAVTDAEEIEVVVRAEDGDLPPDTELAVVDPGEGAADGAEPDVAGAPGEVGVSHAAPVIRSRAAWGADESLRTWAPKIGRVTGAVVHHTAGSNGYTAEQVPAIIRGIYTYHAKTRGWGDIGYNVIVDAFGRAWEGRYGGLSKAVIAAHASGVNGTTFGISVLGNFDVVPVPDAAFRAVAQVIAWKFTVHGITTSGTGVGLNGTPIKRVVGHKDVGQTACPGRYFYPRMGELSSLVKAYQNSATAVSPAPAPTPTPAPSPAPAPAPAPTPTFEVTRLDGKDRYETAAKASRLSHPGTAEVVFVTTGGGYADAMSAGPAATKLHAPILLVKPDAIPDAARAELKRLDPELIYILGGTGAVGAQVAEELGKYATVERLAGQDRYATSAAVGRAGWPERASTVYLASGENYADGLAGGAAAAAQGAPVYVTRAGALPTPVYGELYRLRPSKVVVLGGPAAVSDYVLNLVRAMLPAAQVVRLAGADRYETAAAVASYAWPKGSGTAFLATGTGFADALSGVPAAGSVRAPLLLTRPTCLPPSVDTTLEKLGTDELVVLGGTGAFADGAQDRRC